MDNLAQKTQRKRESGKRYSKSVAGRKSAQKRNKAARQKFREFTTAYKARHGCADCGEQDPIVLEFDHRDPLQKSFAITVISSISRALVELEKCDVVCANCHRRRTHKQRIEHPEYFLRGKGAGIKRRSQKPNSERRNVPRQEWNRDLVRAEGIEPSSTV